MQCRAYPEDCDALVYAPRPRVSLWGGRCAEVRRKTAREAFAEIVCAALAGCTGADSEAYVPAFMRDKAPDPAPIDQPPAVAEIVRSQLDFIFQANALPHNVQVSEAHHDPRALDWMACVKANVTGATGKPMGTQTYRIMIADGKIIDRRSDEDSDNCSSENYQPP